MSVKSGQAVVAMFATSNPTTGAAADADALPTGVLTVNGVDNGAAVTVANVTTGKYKASVTLPELSAGDCVALVISATMVGVAGVGVVWQDTADTKRVSDLNDLAAGAEMDLVDAPNATALEALKTALEAAGSTLALIHAKTTNLPSDPADESSIEGAITAAVGTILAGIPAGLTAQQVWEYATRTITAGGLSEEQAQAACAAALAAIFSAALQTRLANLATVEAVGDLVAAASLT